MSKESFPMGLADAARLIGVSRLALQDAITRGALVAQRDGRKWVVTEDALRAYQPRGRGFNKYRVDGGVVYIEITDKIGQPAYETIVDLTDLPRLLAHGKRWCVMRHDYPYAEMRISGTGRRSLRMHRFILDAPDGIYVDHINGNTLDNRRANLRLVTPGQNCQNRKPHSNTTSGVKNVGWDKTSGKWRVYICLRGRRMSFGYFDSKDEASRAAESARLLHHSHTPVDGRAATEIGEEVGRQLSEFL